MAADGRDRIQTPPPTTRPWRWRGGATLYCAFACRGWHWCRARSRDHVPPSGRRGTAVTRGAKSASHHQDFLTDGVAVAGGGALQQWSVSENTFILLKVDVIFSHCLVPCSSEWSAPSPPCLGPQHSSLCWCDRGTIQLATPPTSPSSSTPAGSRRHETTAPGAVTVMAWLLRHVERTDYPNNRATARRADQLPVQPGDCAASEPSANRAATRSGVQL